MTVAVIPSIISTLTGTGNQQLDQNDCQYFLGRTIDDCDTSTTTDKHGGTVTDGYLSFLFHPTNNNGELTCTGKAAGTGLDRDEAIASINDFCKSKNGQNFTL